MAQPTYLARVGDRWYYERRVPTKLIPLIGQWRWRKSLATGDQRDAQRKARRLAAQHDRDIEQAERKLAMSPAERAVAEFHEAEQTYRAALARLQRIETTEWHTGVDSTFGKRRKELALLDRARADAHAAIVAEGEAKLAELGEVHPAIHAKVRAAGGMAALVEGAEQDRIFERFLETGADALGKADPGQQFDPEEAEASFDEIAAAKARAARLAEERREKAELLDRLGLPSIDALPRRASGPTIHDLYEQWCEECGITEDRQAKLSVYLRRFREMFGDIAAAEITRAQAKEFAATLAQLPNSGFLRIKERGSDVETLLAIVDERPELPRLRTTAIERHLEAVRAILSWAVTEELVPSNPFLNIRPPATAGEPTKVKPFRPDEMRRLLSHVDAAWHHPERRRDIDRWWITYVAVYSGARLAEICQLFKEDVRQERGVWIIDINAEGGKKVKNKPSIRKIPVHPRLIEMGFLDYVAGAKEGGRIFSSLKPHADGRIGHDVSNTFGWLKRYKAGFTSCSHNLHSLRHSFSDACREAQVPAEI